MIYDKDNNKTRVVGVITDGVTTTIVVEKNSWKFPDVLMVYSPAGNKRGHIAVQGVNGNEIEVNPYFEYPENPTTITPGDSVALTSSSWTTSLS